jgi:predicted RNA binding protein YcfA (HicA-like mRNA interferase family)
MLKLVKSDGWQHVRTTGSHRHFRHSEKRGTVTIPGHPSDELAIGTKLSILKQAGLEKRQA